MRDYLHGVEIVGAVLMYQEGDQARWSLDWLYANCDRVCIVMDNWNDETHKVALEYAGKYGDRTRLAYSTVKATDRVSGMRGALKHSFKVRQPLVREFVMEELRKMHEEKPIDLLVWPDSDETFTNCFTDYLTEFWEKSDLTWMMLGFLDVFDSMHVILNQRMAPHGRVFKYVPEINATPWHGRTQYNPYRITNPFRIRHVVVHTYCLTEEYRKRRDFVCNTDFFADGSGKRLLWLLPKDVREMTPTELVDYQLSPRAVMPKNLPITVEEYLADRDKYLVSHPPWAG